MTLPTSAAAAANSNRSAFSHPIELPSLEECAKWDKQREEAIDSLQIKDNKARCQKCKAYIPIVGRLKRPTGTRIDLLQKRIGSLEQYPYGDRNTEIKQLKEEKAQLEAEDAKWDKLRHLPLYSSRITGFKFVCSTCYDDFYQMSQEQRKKKA